MAQHVGDQGRGGGLAVGAGHRHPLRVGSTLAPGKLHLAHHFGGRRLGAAVEIGELGDARTCDAQVVDALDGLVVEQHHRAPLPRGLSPRLGIGTRRARRHGERLHAAAQQVQAVVGHGAARLAEAEHEHAPEVRRGELAPFQILARPHARPPPETRRTAARSRRLQAYPTRSRSARPPSSPTSPSSRSDGAKAP